MSNVIELREYPKGIIGEFRKKIESENNIDGLNAILSEISKIQGKYPEHYDDFLELGRLIQEKITDIMISLLIIDTSDGISSKF